MLNKVINNIQLLLSFTGKRKRLFLIWPLLIIFYTLSNVLISSTIPAYVVAIFSNYVSYLQLGLLLILCFIIGLFNWLKDRLSRKMFWENIYLRMVITAQDAQSFLSEPYELSLNEQQKEMRETSMHYGFSDDNSGVALFFPELVASVSALASLMVIIIVLAKLSLVLPVIAVVTICLAFYAMKNYATVRNSLNKNMKDLYLRYDYYNRIAFSDDASQITRLYNYSSKMKKKLEDSANQIENLESRILKKKLLNTVLLQIFALLRIVTIYGFLIWQALTGKISSTEFTFYFTICTNLELLVNNLWTHTRLFLSANDDLTIGREYIDKSRKYLLTSNYKNSHPLDEAVTIEFDHVYFKYPNAEQYTIQDFNLKINKGEHLALIGHNGAGKSTLMLLLMGYLSPSKGKIIINGKPATAAERKSKFSTMFQDNTVLATSVDNNITLFQPSSPSQIQDVYAKVGLSNILKKGLTGDSILTKHIDPSGVELSGGETETLMLARMLFRRAGAYILDEPSASLDAIKEKELYAAIEKLIHEKTVIFISHRLASISLSDNICLLANGQISAYGKHEQLLQTSQEYRDLYESQSKYYKGGMTLMLKKIHEFIALVPKMNELYPHIILLEVISSILASVLKFINVLFIGLELNLLFNAKQDINRIAYVTAGFIAITIVLSIASKALHDYTEKQTRLINLWAKTSMSKHLFEVDYETFEDAGFRSLYNDVKSGLEFVGGFQLYIENVVSSVVSFMTTLIMSGGVLVTVMVAPAKNGAISNLVLFLVIAILLVFILGVSFLGGKKFGKIMNDFFVFNVQFNQKLNYYFEQAFKDLKVKRLLSLFDPGQVFFREARSDVLSGIDKDRDLQVKAVSVRSFPTIIINTVIGLIYIILGLTILNRGLGVGLIVTSVGTLELLIYDLSSFLNALGNSDASLNVVKQYFKFMNYGSMKNSSDRVPKIDSNNVEIVFHNVSYQYPNRKDYALKNINLTLKGNSKIALVGRNGSGKTTLVKLLLRLINPTSGQITMNGINIQDFDLVAYQKLFSSVPQSTFLYADTVASNISLGEQEDSDKLIASLKKVNLAQKISSFKLGIDTPLTSELDQDGVNLSGGEAQAIGISRAVYRDSPIYVLDEPTAALDPIKEAEMFNYVNQVTDNRMVLFISHRMSMTTYSDKIYVLDGGQLVEQGNHHTLMQNDGLYYQMFKAQQDYFKKMA
ncbi:ABC-type multidrug transport system fused ATPase/permease subunit [Lactobacillus colini]|uniref:ABC-type multidrug transport system fused ATPase/permease subunit n=1 Tax=Lactobacillus colini TaxID=1819254 RepID=A0ABS4MGL9_9LACO|nr:ABC transporter ATP-binding protein [Lactobacillus colini]MBP2058837.1 ABC-type multidrug transport system fused ATPase/permease subunit [Lactobacillus colini]